MASRQNASKGSRGEMSWRTLTVGVAGESVALPPSGAGRDGARAFGVTEGGGPIRVPTPEVASTIHRSNTKRFSSYTDTPSLQIG